MTKITIRGIVLQRAEAAHITSYKEHFECHKGQCGPKCIFNAH